LYSTLTRFNSKRRLKMDLILHAWVKKCHFGNFTRNQLIGWIGHALLVQPCKTAHRIFFLFYILIFIYFLKYETIVRSSAWSFVIQIQIQAV
jgi:hypothetical protein